MPGQSPKRSSTISGSGGKSRSTNSSEVPIWDLTVDDEEPEQVLGSQGKSKDQHCDSIVDISFSLVDSQHFTTQCASCRSRDRLSEILALFQLIPGKEFDWKSNPARWLFPIQ